MLQKTLQIQTSGSGFTDVTARVQQVVAESDVQTGLCVLFLQHTSASLVIQENADLDVLRDLSEWIEELVPEGRAWHHDDEGPDDMPAHIRTALTHTSETIPVSGGRLMLGTWQGLYLWEHRRRPHQRQLVVHLT